MKKHILAAAVLAMAGTSLAQEKSITLKLSQPLELYGGISSGYFYTTNEGTNKSQDGFKLNNAVIGITGSAGILGFDLAVGTFLAPSVWGNVNNPMISYTNGGVVNNEMGVLWGYTTLSPVKNLSIDIGYLTTNVGYEVINTYDNPNINLGVVWFAQPVIYPGVRATFDLTNDISVYAEYNNDTISSRAEAFAVGSLGSLGSIDYAVTYYDYAGFKNFVDVVLSYSLGDIGLGLNVDYQWLDSSAKSPGQDGNAYGVALYVTPNFGQASLPLRLEYFDEGTSGIYNAGMLANKGYTFTVTPTYRPSENTFIRAELSYISTDRKAFRGGAEDSKTTLAVEAGFTF